MVTVAIVSFIAGFLGSTFGSYMASKRATYKAEKEFHNGT